MKKYTLISLVVSAVLCSSAWAQGTGTISGTVRSADDEPLPGVAVLASSDVLPQPRTAVTSRSGEYVLPLLPPGDYDLSFSLEGMDAQTRDTTLLLGQRVRVDVRMGLAAVEDEIRVVGEALIDTTSAELKTSIGEAVIQAVPTGQEYRDLVKLIPGVQYSEESVRGPSAGGSGQDNVYKFDGVNVTLPLFGTLAAEPSSHDIQQVAVVKGGADASDFNRSGGFTIDSISKSGTSDFTGEVSFQLQTEDMTGERDTGSNAEFEQDKDWTVLSLGGPILSDQLFFYTSYYRPTISRDNRANAYGNVPDFDSERDELFGKLTWTPTSNLLVHANYRDSERDEVGISVGEFSSGSTSEGAEASQEIAILDATWVVNPNSFASFEYTDFANESAQRPDNLFDFPIRIDGSVGLDVANLDTQGLLLVPRPIAGEDSYNDFIAPLIDRFGFLRDGARVGGGEVGGGSTINDQDFFREGFSGSYDYVLETGPATHELHAGYQWYRDEEDLSRTS
ncbi:MAG TPA: TonB-dependent receptor, partial [Thermoanaerobaculia bacterium]|nr:TonB-dependent receptor [Thermoanaerobaculia bacterium]